MVRKGPLAKRVSVGLTGRIHRLLAEGFPADGPGAAVLVARDGDVVFRRAYGLANLELNVRLRPEMLFRVGSVTKQFTAVAILLLVAEGQIGLEDDIRKYLPTFPTNGFKVTIEHLLTHTSGVSSYTSTKAYPDLKRKSFKVSELIDLFKDEPFDFGPGECFRYSNSGYVLLGAIIEAVSGQRYDDHLRRRIFEPLDMKHTTYGHNTLVLSGRVPGYVYARDEFRNADYLSMTIPYAAGALVSSVDDLLIWSEALNRHQLVSEGLLERAWTPAKLNNGDRTRYGYGWQISQLGGRKVVSHGGGIDGFAAYLLLIPEDHITVAILYNCAGRGPSLDYVATKIAAMTMGHPMRDPRQVSVDPKVLASYCGSYRIPAGSECSISLDGTRLYMQWQGLERQMLLPQSSRRFFRPQDLTRFEFVPDAAGEWMLQIDTPVEVVLARREAEEP